MYDDTNNANNNDDDDDHSNNRRYIHTKLELRDILDVLKLDNGCLVYKIMKNYTLIYGRRKNRPGFRRSKIKRAVAMAFSICNVLAKEHCPRPVQYITGLCGVSNPKLLLNIPHSLKLNELELNRIGSEYYELEHSRPQDFVDVLCAYLRIPFHIASQLYTYVQRVEWDMYGKQPPVIVAAVMQKVLAELNMLEKGHAEYICEHLNCKQKAVTSAMKEINLSELLKKKEERRFSDIY